MAQSI